MKLFAKEKDIVLKVVNSILIVGAIISIIVVLSTGINIINRQEILSYEDYAKEVCTIDKLEYEGTDEEGKIALEKEREADCKNFYMIDKRDIKETKKANINNFLISLGTTIILLVTIHILNKKI